MPQNSSDTPSSNDEEILRDWEKDVETYFRKHADDLLSNDTERGAKKWVSFIEEELQQFWVVKVGTFCLPNEDSTISRNLNFRVNLLVSESYELPEAFDALKEVIDLYIERNLPLPPVLTDWREELEEGKVKRPRKPGPSKYRDWGRNLHIAWAIHALELGELCPTRNDASQSISGCDLVSDVFTRVTRHSLSYEAAKKIWTNYSNLEDPLSDF